MKRNTTRFLGVALLAMMGGLLLAACSDTDNSSPTPASGIGQKRWTVPETVVHENFKDLGYYIIELPDVTDASMEQKALA